MGKEVVVVIMVVELVMAVDITRQFGIGKMVAGEDREVTEAVVMLS